MQAAQHDDLRGIAFEMAAKNLVLITIENRGRGQLVFVRLWQSEKQSLILVLNFQHWLSQLVKEKSVASVTPTALGLAAAAMLCGSAQRADSNRPKRKTETFQNKDAFENQGYGSGASWSFGLMWHAIQAKNQCAGAKRPGVCLNFYT